MNKATKTQTAQAAEDLGIRIHANKLQIISLVSNIITTGAGIYIGGAVVNTLVVAAAALTGAGFISFMLWFVGMCIVMITSSAVGFFVQSMIIEGDLAKRVSDRVHGAGHAVRGWFAPKLIATESAVKATVSRARTGARSAATK